MLMSIFLLLHITGYIPANTANTLSDVLTMHAVETLVILGGSKIESSFFWQLLALATQWCFFGHRATFRQFPGLGQPAATVLHCRSVLRRFSWVGAMHSKACLRMWCIVVQYSSAETGGQLTGSGLEKITPK